MKSFVGQTYFSVKEQFFQKFSFREIEIFCIKKFPFYYGMQKIQSKYNDTIGV